MMMTPAQQLALGMSWASQGHVEQFDKAGAPYMLHPMRVAMRLRTKDYELMTIAIMHDLIEDTPTNLFQVRAAGFSERVINALACLTHMKGETYDHYIARILTNRDAMLVKLEDLRDNSDITRLKGFREKDNLRAIKYNKAYMKIEAELNK